MRHRLLLLIAAVALGWIYLLAFTFAAGIAAVQVTPTWWLGMFSKSATSALIWLALTHAVAISLVSLPFAWIIGRVYGRLRVPLAFAITTAICAFIEIPTISEDFRAVGPILQSIWLFGAAVLFVALPLEVWVFQTWPSNNRLERSRVASSVNQRGDG
ncbi:MAG TPA: hypothetical protein VNV61_14860 [Steroidobacteraceae bacterium]|nr:hypothetical protein [Steroidobacteraceae bacterium]